MIVLYPTGEQTVQHDLKKQRASIDYESHIYNCWSQGYNFDFEDHTRVSTGHLSQFLRLSEPEVNVWPFCTILTRVARVKKLPECFITYAQKLLILYPEL